MTSELSLEKKALIDLIKLGQAMIVYDEMTDTLHINLVDDEADEVLMLENGVIVRLKEGFVIGFSIPNILRHS